MLLFTTILLQKLQCIDFRGVFRANTVLDNPGNKKNKYKKGLCIQLWYLFLLVLIYLTFLFILFVYFEKQLYLGFKSTKKHILFSISGKFQSKETLPKLCWMSYIVISWELTNSLAWFPYPSGILMSMNDPKPSN